MAEGGAVGAGRARAARGGAARRAAPTRFAAACARRLTRFVYDSACEASTEMATLSAW